MVRISREQMFMEIAHTVAKRGTCPRASVGAVIVRDGRVVSIGYNGAPPGQKHCEEVGCKGERATHIETEEACQRATHAELNAIMFAARQGIATDDCGMFCTHACCVACARAIVTSGISNFIYEIPYRLTDGLEFLDRSNVIVNHNTHRSLIPLGPHKFIPHARFGDCIQCGRHLDHPNHLTPRRNKNDESIRQA